MPQVGVRLNGRNYLWDEAYREAVTNPLRDWPYTPDMLTLMSGYDDDEPGDDAFSPSRLLLCHRQAVLKGQLDYYIEADRVWPLVRGKMVHALMERATYPGALEIIRETRFTTTIATSEGPQRFTAKPDLVVVNRIDTDWPSDAGHGQGNAQETIHVKVVDYKSKSAIKHELVEVQYEHELQVNMYALILSRVLPVYLDLPGAEVVIDELEIDYVDMSRVRRFTSVGWLTDRGKRLSANPLTYDRLQLAPIHLWPLEKIERFVARRIEERLEAFATLPTCEYLGTDKAWLCSYCPVGSECARRTEGTL